MLANLAKRAVTENCTRVEWSVLDWNEPSIKFYKSLGATAMEKTGGASDYGSHASRGNPVEDAPRAGTAERFELRSHAERGNDMKVCSIADPDCEACQ